MMAAPPTTRERPPAWLLLSTGLLSANLLGLGWVLDGWPRALAWVAWALAALIGMALWRFGRRRERLALYLQQGIAAMDQGFALFDPDDRLLLANEAFNESYPGMSARWQPGISFEALIRSAVAAGYTTAPPGGEEAWLVERMARHHSSTEPWLQPLPGGRWQRVHERRGSSGVTVVLRTEVTDLVLAQQGMSAAQAQAQEERELLSLAVEAMPVGIEIYDADDVLLMTNQRMAEWFPGQGYADSIGLQFEALLRRSLSYVALPLDAAGQEEAWIAQRLARRRQPSPPLCQHFPNGLWLLTHEMRTPDGRLVAVRQDVSELMHKERALQASQAQLQAIIGTAGVAILTLDIRCQVLSANPATARMLGYEEAAIVGQDVGLLMSPSVRREVDRLVKQYIASGDIELLNQQRELPMRHQNGRELTVQLALAEVRSADARLFVAVLTDITERKRFEIELQQANERLLHLSTTDALTELANRRLLMQRLEDEWRRALRSKEPLSLLLLDVDYFKLYNDHCGHQAGDVALQAVARVLAACAHRPSDLAARYGGEEFVLLLPQTDAAGALAVAQNCMQSLRAAALPHPLSPLGDWLSLSIGTISGKTSASGSAAQWLAAADLALYKAKAEGRNRVVQATGI